jgi:L-2,4-diaminobutyrate decarboxylase
LAVLVSEQAHYSVSRAISIMGLGENYAIKVPSNTKYQMDIIEMKNVFQSLTRKGIKVIAVVGNACSTATGTFDDLDAIGDFCQENNLWFHVDGAHGASCLLSEKYKFLLKGIEKADSIVWDAHKMLLMPALITAVIFKDGANSFETFSQKASYLFEKESNEEWYNYSHRTIECTKTMMGMKLYVCLSVFGTDIFGEHVTKMNDLTKEFASIIQKSSDFEIAIEPNCNIICFRHLRNEINDLNELQKEIRKKIIKSEKFYITQTLIKGKFYLRCTVINPLTKIEDLKNLLDTIRNI